MTEQEAVERLKCMRLFMQIEDDRNDCKFLEDDYIANDMAIKALEKQIPKKPKFYAHNYHCANCATIVGNNEFKWQRFLYCDKCGQKLDWSDEE